MNTSATLPQAILIACLSGGIGGALFCSEALAQPTQAQQSAAQRTQYSIPPGSLDQVLNGFAVAAGIHLAIDGSLTNNQTSPGLKGSYTVESGIAKILSGTGLSARRQTDGSYTLQKAADGSVMVMPPVTVEGSELGLRTEGTGSYTTNISSYGNGQNLKELPQTVTVMTHELLQDQGVQTLDGALKRAPGVTVQYFNPLGANFSARAFDITNLLIDGSLPGSTYVWLPEQRRDLAMYDSVEVLRGSDALYGNSGEPGGAINLVRKKPTSEFQLKAQAFAGSWNRYRGELDASGPLALDGRIRGRIVGVYEGREYFYDVANTDKHVLYGIVEADITDSTLLTVGGNVLDLDSTGYWRYGLPRFSNGGDIELPRSTFLSTPDSGLSSKNNNWFIRIDQAIGHDWSLRVDAARDKADGEWEDVGFRGALDPITFSGLAPNPWRGTKTALTEEKSAVTLKGVFPLFGREHRLSLGANLHKLSRDASDFGVFGSDITFPDIYEFDPYDYQSNDPYSPLADAEREEINKGIYGLLAMQLTDPLTLIVGGRLNWYEFRFLSTSYTETGAVSFTFPYDYDDDSVFTPSIGLVYNISDQWSTYASFAETYIAATWALAGPPPGTPLDPVTGGTYEIGAKGRLFDSRLNTNIALFYIERNGEPAFDVNYPYTPTAAGPECCYLDDGEIVSQGVDFEISGELIEGWQIQAGYTFNDNEDKGGGGRFSTITPEHLFKLWTSHTLKGPFDGLTIGGGITAQSSNYRRGSVRTFNQDTGLYDGPLVDFDFTESGYTLVDLFAEYRFNENLTATLNVNNVFDKTYYETVGAGVGAFSGNWYGAPRNYSLAVRYSP